MAGQPELGRTEAEHGQGLSDSHGEALDIQLKLDQRTEAELEALKVYVDEGATIELCNNAFQRLASRACRSDFYHVVFEGWRYLRQDLRTEGLDADKAFQYCHDRLISLPPETGSALELGFVYDLVAELILGIDARRSDSDLAQHFFFPARWKRWSALIEELDLNRHLHAAITIHDEATATRCAELVKLICFCRTYAQLRTPEADLSSLWPSLSACLHSPNVNLHAFVRNTTCHLVTLTSHHVQQDVIHKLLAVIASAASPLVQQEACLTLMLVVNDVQAALLRRKQDLAQTPALGRALEACLPVLQELIMLRGHFNLRACALKAAQQLVLLMNMTTWQACLPVRGSGNELERISATWFILLRQWPGLSTLPFVPVSQAPVITIDVPLPMSDLIQDVTALADDERCHLAALCAVGALSAIVEAAGYASRLWQPLWRSGEYLIHLTGCSALVQFFVKQAETCLRELEVHRLSAPWRYAEGALNFIATLIQEEASPSGHLVERYGRMLSHAVTVPDPPDTLARVLEDASRAEVEDSLRIYALRHGPGKGLRFNDAWQTLIEPALRSRLPEVRTAAVQGLGLLKALKHPFCERSLLEMVQNDEDSEVRMAAMVVLWGEDPHDPQRPRANATYSQYLAAHALRRSALFLAPICEELRAMELGVKLHNAEAECC
ncbi:uncharacterized protein MONBRDRAFT_37687 [Monosiga brevicollis MX1]|uniref:Uncharacterized protein n=1 Tax=Monosiga brevicollis TaxID=81824 RepID=A9V3A4_MONBE|nr:uncharacterized protein MONBRDRAFT_37687 [Monosiga brevicollis MX1]EDQ88154.1 predicted protein [Monosiga brevicollis MX1]|eukprot:XP_001747230.1 hypothetical protein [Monosiga brevicollis MX1]